MTANEMNTTYCASRNLEIIINHHHHCTVGNHKNKIKLIMCALKLKSVLIRR